MVKKTFLKNFLRHTVKERWRYTAALIISICLHLTIMLAYAPNYIEVRDIAVEFELVEGAEQQPMAPEAQGPRTAVPESPEEKATPELPEDPAPDDPPAPDKGIIVGDTDLITDSGEEETLLDSETGDKADSASDTQTSDDTESIADTETTTIPKEVDSESNSDTGSETDTSTDTASETDSATDDTDDTDDTDSTRSPIRMAASTDSDSSTSDSAESATSLASTDTDSSTDTGPKGHRFPESAGAMSAGDNAICLHDVFEYGKKNPSWMAWLRMQAFAGTKYERGLSNILKSFYIYNEMVSATEINPMTELEGVLISADNFAAFDTYQVVTTYNVGQDVLMRRLQKNMGGKPGFKAGQTQQGISAVHEETYRWDMVGSGRVLVASDATKGALNPKWPKNVTCMKSRPAFTGDSQKQFEQLVRASLGPAKEGERWPVIMLATRDPGAAGLAYKPNLKKYFKWAIVKGYFSEPIQITGEIKFNDDPAVMQQAKEEVARLIRYGENNQVVRFFKFDRILSNIQYEVVGDTLRFTAPMTEDQAVKLLAALNVYSRILNNALMPE